MRPEALREETRKAAVAKGAGTGSDTGRDL
jgi:hypothetical protein